MPRTKKLPLEVLAPAMLPDVPRGESAPPIVWPTLFGNENPVEIEIGFGKGLFLTTSATAHPNVNFFGVEIVRKYQFYAAIRAIGRGLTNVRVACGDGRAILKERVATGSVEAVHVYFPDPWWKARHRKRRVFTPEFCHKAGDVLRSGGRLSIATDVELYFGVMTRIVRDLGSAFVPLPTPTASDPQHDMDYLTNFERKFRKEGRPIYRALYERTADALPTTIAPDPGISGEFVEFQGLVEHNDTDLEYRMPRFRAVLFDFDGTLADSYAAITASVNHVLEHHGRPALAEAQVRRLVGHGLAQLMETVLPGVDPDVAARLYREHHPSVLREHTRLLPGVADGLVALRRAGVKLGVCSNKPSRFTQACLDILEISQHFEVVFGPEEAGAAKPDPAMLLKALENLGVSKEQSLYVGDMEVDIEAGRRAGVETWVLPTGSHDEATLRAAGCGRLFPEMGLIVSEVLKSAPLSPRAC